MTLFIATVGELVIVQLCVLWIWLKVLIDAVKYKQDTVSNQRLLFTSIGLVLNAISIIGLMGFRMVEYITGYWPFVPAIVSCYALLALGNIMFIISAAIGSPNARTLKMFIFLTIIWTILCIWSYYFEWGYST